MRRKLLCTLLFLGVLVSCAPYDQTKDFLSAEFWKKATVADVQKEIKNGGDVKARSEEEKTALWTPLMFASSYNSDPKVIEILIKHGADVKVSDKEGKTAIDYAKDNEKINESNIYWNWSLGD